ncbi:MAG: hypothetical protein HC913_15490 [Microscillaceae bacterium]|nr:hypothetical protein [Microscillaceae bacterium]
MARIAFLLMLLWPGALRAQVLTVIKKTGIPAFVQSAIDKRGFIYLANAEGVVYQLDSLGRETFVYAPRRVAEVHRLEAKMGLRIFIFYREWQGFAFLDRFLNETGYYTFPSEQIGFVQMATVSADNLLWLWDSSDFSLKKYNPQTQQVVLQTPLDLQLAAEDYEVWAMEEYQNRLFVCTRTQGLLVFDNLGNFEQKLAIQVPNVPVFAQDQLFWVEEQVLHLLHLYSLKRQQFSLPATYTWRAVFPRPGAEWLGFTATELLWLK